VHVSLLKLHGQSMSSDWIKVISQSITVLPQSSVSHQFVVRAITGTVVSLNAVLTLMCTAVKLFTVLLKLVKQLAYIQNTGYCSKELLVISS